MEKKESGDVGVQLSMVYDGTPKHAVLEINSTHGT